jgi:hypothetical protein
VDDVAFTRRLQLSAVILGLDLHDHVIAGEGGQFFSFREAGLLGPVSRRSSPRAARIPPRLRQPRGADRHPTCLGRAITL